MSEDEAASSSDDAVDDSCEDSDEDDDLEVVSAAEFTSELPQVISARSTRSRTSSEAAEDSESHELDDVAPRATKPVKKTSHPKFKKDVPQALFDSDSDEYEFVRVRKAVSKSKAPVCKPDSASEDSMPEAPPVRRRRDSDIEMAEFIQKGLVDIPQTHRRLADDTVGLDAAIAASMASEEPRSRRSSTASGYSSGRDLSVPASASEMESDPGSEHEAELHPKKKSKKSKKTSAARQRQADSEKPEIQAPAAQAAASKAPVGASNRPESSWDISARLVLPAPNKAISLTAQHPELQSVLRSGVLQIKLFLLFTNAYPMMISRAGFARPYLIAAAQLRPTSAKILERLLTDPQFGAILAPILLDRVNILRGNMKRCAVSCIFAFFGLAGLDPSKVKERVEELLKDHRYIFPVDPRTGQLQLNKPFRHGAIKFILKEEVFTSSSFVTQNLDRFPATNQKKPDQRELADAMVALVATAVYAALLELRMTGQRQNIAFTEDAYEDTYRNHMDSLKQVREKSPIPFHKLMHEFFNDVTASNQTAHTSSGSSATLIQLGDVPDSD
ncbi:hypothetical protein B0H15DRAFT_847038 [Mycena belliarum]|uniref:DUF6532 domain-containing protein n=1 Tax=Mycena belliarum TaxID=1033014 RepID=A0AAD6XQI3_9AGAR|nr:hypothetical protein B0H15DRAFT_847038 [Mycena belliae]